jgi:hypothetical protein
MNARVGIEGSRDPPPYSEKRWRKRREGLCKNIRNLDYEEMCKGRERKRGDRIGLQWIDVKRLQSVWRGLGKGMDR